MNTSYDDDDDDGGDSGSERTTIVTPGVTPGLWDGTIMGRHDQAIWIPPEGSGVYRTWDGRVHSLMVTW